MHIRHVEVKNETYTALSLLTVKFVTVESR